MSLLPTDKREVLREDPASMIIFGAIKSGKTTISAHLTTDEKRKWLLLEFEPNGADYVESRVIDFPKELRKLRKTEPNLSMFSLIKKVGEDIKAADYPYDGIIVDTVTKLEEFALPLAAALYKSTAMGATWSGKDVRTLPNGAGYLHLRNAYQKMVDIISGWANKVIFLGHTADKLVGKEGKEVSAKALDLTGKIANIACAKVDAVAYCYREDNKTILNFQTSEELIVGARCGHLKGQKMVIAESNSEGDLTVYWDKVFKEQTK